MATAAPKVTVVIPNWNTEHWIKGCLDGLRTQAYQDFKVILVDSGSEDNSVTFTQNNYPEVEVLKLKKNKGFAVAVNAGIQQAQSEYVALLNVDTIPQPKWLESLVEVMEQSERDVASLASKMLSLQNPALVDDAGDTLSWYGSARKRGWNEPASHYTKPEKVFSACAGAALYRRTFLEELEGLDEGFGSYLEDIDLGLRGHLLGYRCLYVPTAHVYHKGQGAKTPRPHYVYLMTQNRLALLVKNIPLILLIKHSWHILFGQLYFFLVYKQPYHSLRGIWAFLKRLPTLLRQRRYIQKHKKITSQALDNLLSTELGEPPLKKIIKRKLINR